MGGRVEEASRPLTQRSQQVTELSAVLGGMLLPGDAHFGRERGGRVCYAFALREDYFHHVQKQLHKGLSLTSAGPDARQ